MCGRRLKMFLLSLVLSSVVLLQPCFSDVTLTEQEVREMLSEIEQSKKELTLSKEELTQSKTELNKVLNTYQEQKKSYEMQLKEARRDKVLLLIYGITVSAASCIYAFLR